MKRRFQMRDGEKFFAEGRDNVVYELKQKQMKQAGDYRIALRRKVLSQLLSLGRDARLFQNNRRSAGWDAGETEFEIVNGTAAGGGSLFGVGVNSDAGLTGSIVLERANIRRG